jgi:hypothetical protein
MAGAGRTELPVVARNRPTESIGWISLEHLLEARARHVEEERTRDGSLPLFAIVPRWMRG